MDLSKHRLVDAAVLIEFDAMCTAVTNNVKMFGAACCHGYKVYAVFYSVLSALPTKISCHALPRFRQSLLPQDLQIVLPIGLGP